MAIRAAFGLGVEVAGADRLMMIHKVSFIQLAARQLQGPDPRRRRRQGHHARQLVRRHLPGSEELHRQHGGRSRELARGCIRSSKLAEEQKKAWLADRTGAIVGVETAKRFGWKVGDRIPLQVADLPQAGRHRLGVHHRRHLRLAEVKGTDKTQFFFHYDYLNETIAQHAVRRPGRLVRVRVDEPEAVGRASPSGSTRMFANSPTETKTATEKAFVSDFAKQIGDIGTIMIAIAGGGDVHDPARHRQHHGPVDPRAHQRAGGAQDARVQRTAGARAWCCSSRARSRSSAAGSASRWRGC